MVFSPFLCYQDILPRITNWSQMSMTAKITVEERFVQPFFILRNGIRRHLVFIIFPL